MTPLLLRAPVAGGAFGEGGILPGAWVELRSSLYALRAQRFCLTGKHSPFSLGSEDIPHCRLSELEDAIAQTHYIYVNVRDGENFCRAC